MKKIALAMSGILVAFVGIFVVATTSVKAIELSDEQEEAIVTHCDTIKENLKNLQHRDSRARVYLGRHYEIILNKFITPLNVRMVENNLIDDDLINSQTIFSKTRTNFIIDYIEYQKVLENLVSMDCKNEPAKFYGKLEEARLKRSVVSKDVVKLRTLAGEQIELVNALEETL